MFGRFEDLEAWREARHLANQVYDATKGHFDRSLLYQIRSAAVSPMSNIAEGFERKGTREFIRFLRIAKASTAEVRSHLYLALDQKYISHKDFQQITQTALSTGRLLGGLIRYLLKKS